MESTITQSQAEDLALDILNLSRSTLLIKLRFLEPALLQLPFDKDAETTLATDGFCLYYHFAHILKSYKIQKELVMRDYLHSVFHCIFHHPFIGTLVDSFAWNLACDIAVEAALSELRLPELTCSRCEKQQKILKDLKEFVPVLTAEKLYRHFNDSDMPPEEMETLRSFFMADEHDLWYQLSNSSLKSNSTEQENKEEHSQSENEKNDSNQETPGENLEQESDAKKQETGASEEDTDGETSPSPSPRKEEQEKLWQEIASRIQTDLETTSLKYGDKTGTLLQGIKECTREKTDYKEFLRKFAVLGEEIHINDDEFDYIYYSYGMELYDNIPLIEPLEYREIKKIRDFVIAIDTSASVKGDTIQSFVQKTFDILNQEESFFDQINLHMIQCDTSIQDIFVIHHQKDLEQYLQRLQLKGFGGTDFRPVFSYVEEMREKGELKDLQGLLYFTDGDGIYPQTPTDYHTAFLFTEDVDPSIKVPVWAMKVLLDEDSLR